MSRHCRPLPHVGNTASCSAIARKQFPRELPESRHLSARNPYDYSSAITPFAPNISDDLAIAGACRWNAPARPSSQHICFGVLMQVGLVHYLSLIAELENFCIRPRHASDALCLEFVKLNAYSTGSARYARESARHAI